MSNSARFAFRRIRPRGTSRRSALAAFALSLVFLAAIACPSDARPREVIRIAVDGHALDVETARTPEDRERGLKYRSELCDTCGMLFVFPDEERRAFYTRDVFFALDIAYFGADGRLLEVRTLAANGGRLPEDDADEDSAGDPSFGERGPETFPSQQAFQYALAVKAGWFEQKRIRRYARLRLPHDLPAL